MRMGEIKLKNAFVKLAEGSVTVRRPNTKTSVPSGPRCAITPTGEIVCTYMVQEALGQNDFNPHVARSLDDGITWQDEGPIWPHLHNRFSIFGSVSSSPTGDLYFFGTQTIVDRPGEPNWCKATQGLKANELIWASSSDSHSWSEPMPIPMPFPGAAEAPGAMCVTRDGTWHACYSPYNTFDPAVVVPRNQVVLLSRSSDSKRWRHTAMLRFRNELASAAEAWVVELADGRLLGTCWNLNQRDGSDYPNAYSISSDGGWTWSPTRSTGIFGQASALAALPDGGALFVYNQRRHGRIGVWLARTRPTVSDFGVESNEIIWEAPEVPSAGAHAEWTQFTFGEPSALLMREGRILVVLWCIQGGVGSIKYVKLEFTK
jgi:hypothetical protein